VVWGWLSEHRVMRLTRLQVPAYSSFVGHGSHCPKLSTAGLVHMANTCLLASTSLPCAATANRLYEECDGMELMKSERAGGGMLQWGRRLGAFG
jgi:hypothetical protein